ncbi:MAG: T9SS type A sorting domain-containing protein [Bacteroidota bacterium]
MKKQLFLIASILLTGIQANSQIALDNITAQYFTTDNTAALDAHLDVNNLNGYPVDINIVRTIDYKTPGHDELFCFGLYCYLPNTDTSQFSTTVLSMSTDGTFKPEIIPNGIDGMDRLSYLFYDVNNMADAVSVTIEFYINTLAGIKENTSDSYLKFKNEVNNFTVFNYKLPVGSSGGRIDIHNMLGSRLNSIELSEKQGMKMVTTNALSNGVYLVSLIINNKPAHSYRMIVNHQAGN